MPDTVDTARDRIYKLLVRWLPEEDWDVIDPALNALIAAVAAEHTAEIDMLRGVLAEESDQLHAALEALDPDPPS